MNTLQNVYDKLADKTELAKHEVNLSLIDDYKAMVIKAKNSYQIANEKIIELKNNSKSIGPLFNTAEQRFMNVNTIYLTIKKYTQDIGLKIPNEIIKEHELNLEYFNKIDGARKLLNLIK